ncbi:MAG: phosphoribosylformylglycinamidine synthase subunit PurL [Deltaproteobacteria bacterium]|nr:phosphoribosylformylglycinamidine synthase subunit PurL [Deltaproteobacteria bacterium]
MSSKQKKLVALLADVDATTVEHAKEMGLSPDEFDRATALIGRVPNKVELGCISAMWSEHCSYKSSRVHLRRLPTTGPRVLVGPGENAGVVDVEPEKANGWAVAFKVESHNHPSYIEPYQGAATGVGGILRDVFTMGARPIAAMNLLRFGRVDHEKTPALVDGVVRGIGGYGNCFGVPTVWSTAEFDRAYDGNVLVNAFALGVLQKDAIWKGNASGVGNPVMYVGAKTGRDGIHGATMASDSFSEGQEQERPTVQVGDPFKEKLLVEACLELFARGSELLVGIQDMGAAGLTSSAFEMASRAGSGVALDLDQVPMRETGMTAYEIMLSESQERMLLVAQRGKEAAVRAIFAKWDLDCTVVGAVTDDGLVRLTRGGVEVCRLPAAPLADEAPRYERPHVPPPPPPPLSRDDTRALLARPADAIRDVLLSPTLAPKTWVYRQYDREVGAGTLMDGTQASAALVRVPGTDKAVAMALCCNSRHCSLDPHEGAKRAVVEGYARVAAVGAIAIGVTDCLNYGSPQVPEQMGQIVAGVDGIAEACRTLDVPVVSGNVSLYNQTDDKAVLPTPTVGVVGVVDDVHKVAPAQGLKAGDVLLRLGEPPTSVDGSFAVWQHAGRKGGLAKLDLSSTTALCALVRALRTGGNVLDARPVLAGGLATTIFEVARQCDLVARATLPEGEDFLTGFLGEDRLTFLVVVDNQGIDAVRARCAAAGIECAVLGSLGVAPSFRLADAQGERVFDADFKALVDAAEAIVPALVSGPRARSAS